MKSFDTVHAVWEYYDGPRTGIADFQGKPHYFSCDWEESENDHDHVFAISPISEQFLRLALEQQVIWRKWELAFHSGHCSADTHPGLGGRDPRYDELQQLINDHIHALPITKTHLRGNFQPTSIDTQLPPGVIQPLKVSWSGAV